MGLGVFDGALVCGTLVCETLGVCETLRCETLVCATRVFEKKKHELGWAVSVVDFLF